MLREKSQTQKATSCMKPFTGHSGKDKIYRDRKQTSGCQEL